MNEQKGIVLNILLEVNIWEPSDSKLLGIIQLYREAHFNQEDQFEQVNVSNSENDQLCVLLMSRERLAGGWLASTLLRSWFSVLILQDFKWVSVGSCVVDHGLTLPMGTLTSGPWTEEGILPALTGVTVLRPGGQTSTVMHSWLAPRPPFWLLVTQTVFFSD